MKKILTFIICVLLVFSASACTSFDLQENDVSTNSNAQYNITLLRALTGSDEVSSIKSLSINYENNSKTLKITDIKDWEFLNKYVYSNTISFEKKEKLTNSGKTNLIKIGSSEEDIYLLKDGTIIIQEMCGDSDVKEKDRSFEIYKAEEKYVLNEKRLGDLLKKYDTANKTSQKETVTSSNNAVKGQVTSSNTDNSNKKEQTSESQITLKNSKLPEVKFSTENNGVRFRDVVNLSDVGYAAVGIRTNEIFARSIIQTYDNNFNLVKEFSYEYGYGFVKISPCSDGGFLIGAENFDEIIKLNSNFETEWTAPFSDKIELAYIQDFAEIGPNCFAVIYISYDDERNNGIHNLSYLDNKGNFIKKVQLMNDSVNKHIFEDIIADGKGGFYLFTSCDKSLAKNFPLVAKNYDSKKENEVAIMHFSSDKELTWVKTFGGLGDDWVEDSAIDNKGNIYIALGTNSPDADLFWDMSFKESHPCRRMLIKLNKNGDLIYKVPLSAGGMAAKQTFGINLKDEKAYVIGMANYFDGYQNKYQCEQIPFTQTEVEGRLFCVFNACIDSNGKELSRDIFRCDINDTPCDSTMSANGTLIIVGSVSNNDNSFNIEFPSGINFLPSLFIY